jgi:hypothetical protein
MDFLKVQAAVGKISRYNPASFDENISFGVEIEFTAPQVDLVGYCRDHEVKKLKGHRGPYKICSTAGRTHYASKLADLTGFEVIQNQYSGTNYTVWQVKYDCSVRTKREGYVGGYELVSPILYGIDGLKKLQKIVKALEILNCETTDSCGTHVHYGFETFFENGSAPQAENERLYYLDGIQKAYSEYETVLDGFCAARRRENKSYYCQSTKQQYESRKDYAHLQVDGIPNALSVLGTRYLKLNVQCLKDKKTIEIRQLEGTLDFDKISAWIYLNQKLVHRSLSNVHDYTGGEKTLADLLEFLKLEDSDYLDKDVAAATKRFAKVDGRGRKSAAA